MTKKTRPVALFAKNLSRLMAEKRISIREAARIAGVGPSTIMSWKSGASPGDFVAVKRLARALGTSLSYILTGEDDWERAAVVTDIFEEETPIFDGYAKIVVHKLLPRAKNNK